MKAQVTPKFNLPNFVQFCEVDGVLDVGSLTDEELEKYIDAWIKSFRAHALKRRAMRERDTSKRGTPYEASTRKD